MRGAGLRGRAQAQRRGTRLRHRLLLLLSSLTVVLGTLLLTPNETGAQNQFIRIDPPIGALPVAPAVQRAPAAPAVRSVPVAPSVRGVNAAPLTDFAFYPPPSAGAQPLRLLVVLHG